MSVDGQNRRMAFIRAAWPVPVVVVLLVLVLFAALGGSATGGGTYRPVPLATPTSQAQCAAGTTAPGCNRHSTTQTTPGTSHADRHSLWFTIPFLLLVYGVFALAALFLVGWAVAAVTGVFGGASQLRIRPRRRAADAAPGAEDALGGGRSAPAWVDDAVVAGLADLDLDDADPRRAIIAAWARLERAAADAGTHRLPSDAPTDLVVRLLAAHAITRATLDELAARYVEARFSAHPLDGSARDAARAALERIRAELTPAVPA